MFDFDKYKEAVVEIAEKAFSGDYGDNPFEVGSDANKAMEKDAWERIGRFDPDNWLLDSGSPIDGPIMEAIRDVYDSTAEKAALDGSPESFQNAWAEEQNEARAYTDRGAPTSKDTVLLQSDNIPRDLSVMDKQNEARIAAGEKPLYLENATIEQLAGMGIDASRFKDPDSPPLEIPVENNGNEVDQPVESTAVPEEVVPASNDTDGEQHADSNVAGNDVTPPENNADLDKPGEIADSEIKELMANIEPKYDENGNLIDLVSKDEDGDETSLTDMLAALLESDPEGIGEIYRTAIDPEKNGGNPVECFSHLMEGYLADKLAERPDVDAGEVKPEDAGSTVANDDVADGEKKDITYQDKFDYHSERLDEIKKEPVQLRTDTVKAYHEMEQVYAAYKGGIEIKGKVPDAVDFGITVYNFLKTNPLDTLLVYGIRAIIREFGKDKVDNETISDKVTTSEPTDKHGFREDGTIDHSPDKNTVDAVGIARKVDPVAGTSFGADMSQVDKRSTPDVTIRSTNPDGMNGRGVQVTLDNADKFTFPDVRLVDIKGTSMLVDPFGKVLDVIGDSDKYHVGQILGGKLDVSGSKAGAEALETYARDNGISVDQAKIEISVECQERFAERIESTFKPEAKAIETYIIPREQETRAELNTALATIERLETMPDSPVSKEDLDKMKADILAARDTLDGKIETLKDRVLGLEASAKKHTYDQSISDRFSAAVSSEKNAVGRSVLTVDLGVDRKKMDAVTQKGIEAIKDKVSSYNATRPEMDRISYDPKSGSFVDRFGINDKGEYVGNKNGQFMAQGVSGPETAEQKADWVKEHFDASRFDVANILGETKMETQGVDINDPSNRVDQPPINQVEPNDPNAHVEKDPAKIDADPTKVDVDPAKVDNDPTKIEVDPSKVEADSTQIEKDPTKLDAEPTPDAQVEHNENGIEAKPEEQPVDENLNDTDVNQTDTGIDIKPEDQPPADQELQPDNVEGGQNPDDAMPDSLPDPVESQPETFTEELNPADTEISPDDTGVPDETIPDDQTATDTSADETEQQADNGDTNDTAPQDNSDESEDEDDAVALEDDEESDVVTDKRDDPAAAEEEDSTEANQEDGQKDVAQPEDEVQPNDTDTDSNTDNSNKNEVDAAAEEDEDNDSDPVAIGDDDSSDANMAVSAKDAIEGNDTDRETEEKDDDKTGKADDSAVDKFKDLLGDIGDIIDKMQGGENLGEAVLEHIQDQITDKINEIKDFLSEIKDADTLGEIMDICSDKLLDYAVDAVKAEINEAMDYFDLFKDLFDKLVDAFGPENGNDLCSDVVMRCNDPDMVPEMQSGISEIATEARPSYEAGEPDTITADGMNISNDSVTSAETDADVTDFDTPEAVEDFVETVEDHVTEEIQEAIEQAHGDIAADDTPVDTPVENTEVQPPDVEAVPDDLGAGDGFDPTEAVGGGEEEAIEAIAEILL